MAPQVPLPRLILVLLSWGAVPVVDVLLAPQPDEAPIFLLPLLLSLPPVLLPEKERTADWGPPPTPPQHRTPHLDSVAGTAVEDPRGSLLRPAALKERIEAGECIRCVLGVVFRWLSGGGAEAAAATPDTKEDETVKSEDKDQRERGT